MFLTRPPGTVTVVETSSGLWHALAGESFVGARRHAVRLRCGATTGAAPGGYAVPSELTCARCKAAIAKAQT